MQSPSDIITTQNLSNTYSADPDIGNNGVALREKLRGELTALYERSKEQKVPNTILNSSIYSQIRDRLFDRKCINDDMFDELKQTVLKASPKFIDNLKILTNGNFTESELQIALLIKCGFRPSEMTVLFALSNGAVVSRRNTLAAKVFDKKESVEVINGIIRLL